MGRTSGLGGLGAQATALLLRQPITVVPWALRMFLLHSIQIYVSGLRKALEPVGADAALVTRTPD